MADLVITAANVVAGATTTPNKNYTAGATITAGQVVVLNSSNQWVLADANGVSGINLSDTSQAVGIALHAASSGQPLAVHLAGDITIGATVTVGAVYVVSGSGAGGGVAPVADLVTGWFTTILGVGKTAAIITVNFLKSGVAVP